MRSRKLSTSVWVISIVSLLAFVGVTLYSRQLSTPLKENTFIPNAEVITPEIELLQAYIRIDTSNPPGKELAGARFLIDELARRGVKAELIESAPGRANVYARIEGRADGDGLMLLNHIDVYPAAAGGWSEPPFAANTKMNMLYGRGALDMKSVGICQLLAFAEFAVSGKVPERDIVFLATADEETGGDLGIAWLLEHRPDIFEGVGYALNEGGISESLKEVPTYFGIEVGSRQFVSLELRSKERRSLERARSAMLPLTNPRDPARVLPEMPGLLRDASRFRKDNRELLANVEQTIADGDFFRLAAPYRALFQSSAIPGGIRPDDGGGFVLDVLLSNLPDEEPQAAIAGIRRITAPFDVEIDVIKTQGPAPITRFDTPMFETIRSVLIEQYGGGIFVGPLVLPYSANDSRYLRVRGIRAYGVCPFPLSIYQTWGIHGGDERVRLDWFVDGVDVMRRI
ncbi:MAG: M20/M25/M40 family metallo-hydrolase, partial [Thermoanaerobaculia bacterium]|nr:M20/M25/M40 family metallo-hydrolase [Thermoanaerobaculia bacterium]